MHNSRSSLPSLLRFRWESGDVLIEEAQKRLLGIDRLKEPLDGLGHGKFLLAPRYAPGSTGGSGGGTGFGCRHFRIPQPISTPTGARITAMNPVGTIWRRSK